MKKSLLIISLTPVMSVFAQTGTPAFVEGVPAQQPQTAAPQFQGQPGPAQYPQTAAPQSQGQHHQSNPGAHLNDEPDHDEIVGSVIGIDEDKQMIRIMTKKGPVSLKLTEDSELLIPGERPESLLDMDPNEFKKESKGRMVRIASRDGKIDHIEPAQD